MIIVDRIEGEYAVVYFNELKRDIPLSALPKGVHEGSILKESNGGYQFDEAAEAERRKHISERTSRIFGRK